MAWIWNKFKETGTFKQCNHVNKIVGARRVSRFPPNQQNGSKITPKTVARGNGVA